ncbi:LmeA family phospholipid-binding protein [Paraliomyxa miuraensis]|uniref:LmeA family phospholipid-binding protein n=1 Tax=Paraliomyxa miuraensis TaxID=376150 RepID=UPI002254F436|nr:DUF2993 domain-containing protein [Paraliomyxa miuraensis]MCX4241383.1 DUF2993 domain-containing protein [Paraliomyxa miuraensis]
MKKLVILVVVLLVLGAIVGGLAYADVHVRELAEEHAEQQLAKALPQAKGIDVEFDGFPFTLGVLLDGEVEALHVRIGAVEEAGLSATDVSLDVDTISLDKDALIDEQRLVVTDIGKATAQAFVTDDDVSRVIATQNVGVAKIVFSPGKAKGVYKGQELEVKARVEGRLVQLAVPMAGVPPLVFPLPSMDVLPCSPQLELLEGKARLACSIDDLPPTLKAAMAKG